MENIKEKLENIYKKHKNIVVVLILCGIVVITFAALTLSAQKNLKSEESEEIEEVKEPAVVEENNTFIATEKTDNQKVYISGEVVNPGVYDISTGDRIDDIINYAGGVTEEANITYINLAEIVTDEQHIIIPNDEQVSESTTVNGNTNSNTTSSKININKASVSELTQLNGVGEATAKSIVEYRETNGKFNSIEDIKKVSGIGDKTFEKFKDQIDVK